jgi:hypothetical protein
MKKSLLFLSILCFAWAGTVFSSPYFSCDPQPETDTYEVYIDSATFPKVVYPKYSRLQLNLFSLSLKTGIHTIRVISCNETGCSEWSEPFYVEVDCYYRSCYVDINGRSVKIRK